MLPLQGVYEIAIPVENLPRAQTFYCDILGLKIGLRDEKRNWLFLYVGGNAGMVVLQENAGDWPSQHFAFQVDKGDLESAAASLREQGVEVEGPIFHSWMDSTSIYFSDPDGHQLEILALAQSSR